MSLWDPAPIVSRVAIAFGFGPEELTMGRRTPRRVTARGVAAYLLRETGKYSYTDLTRILHYGDHTSVRAAVLRTIQHLATDPELRNVVQLLRVQLEIPRKGEP